MPATSVSPTPTMVSHPVIHPAHFQPTPVQTRYGDLSIYYSILPLNSSPMTFTEEKANL